MFRSSPSFAVIAVSAALLAGQPLLGALVGCDTIATVTTQGTPTTDPSNGYLYENDVTVVTSFTAGGATYEPLVEYPKAAFDLKVGRDATRVWYERNNLPSNGNDTGYTGNALADLDHMFDTPLRINFGSDNTFVRTLEALRFTSVKGVQLNEPLALTDAGVSVNDELHARWRKAGVCVNVRVSS